MAKVTFKTLNPKANLFTELSKEGEYPWWEKMKKHSDLYIEIRKDNNINVYYQGGSVVRLHYCSKHKKIQAFTHPKYLGGKGKTYVNCIDILDEKFDSILENIRTHYSQKKGISKEKWSEKYIQGNIIVKNKHNYLDSEFAYVEDGIDIRIDLVECIAGELRFVELKRIDDNRMVSLDMHPEILSQVASYREFIKMHKEDIIDYYKRLYAIKKVLKLPVPFSEPQKLNTEPKLLIFDRWIKETDGRSTHRSMMEQILEEVAEPKIDYTIINSLDVPSRYFYRKELQRQLHFYQTELKDTAEVGGLFLNQGRDFVLIERDCHHNLFSSIIDGPVGVLKYFKDYGIAWWGENVKYERPTGHLVSSQIHCLNHLFALRNDPVIIKEIIENATGLKIDTILPSPIDKQGYIAFEFVYKNKELLGENYESRGARCTSVDAFVYAKLLNGKKILIPIEWKYTETYKGDEARESSFVRYTRIHKGSDCQKWTSLYRADPFYELMRQTLLAERIISAEGCGIEADDYAHIVVCPNGNKELLDDIDTFKSTLSNKGQKRLHVIDPEALLAPLEHFVEYKDLINYLQTRYWKK